MEGTQQLRSRQARGRVTPWSANPRNAVPRDVSVVAGLRYYSPGIGRWTNRDPIGNELFLAAHSGTASEDATVAVRLQAVSAPFKFVRNAPVDHFDLLGLACINVDPKCTASMLKGYYYLPEKGAKVLIPLTGRVCGIDGIYVPKGEGGGCHIGKVPDWGTINIKCDICQVSVGGWWWFNIPTWAICKLKEQKYGPGWCLGWYPRADGCKRPYGWPDCP